MQSIETREHPVQNVDEAGRAMMGWRKIDGHVAANYIARISSAATDRTWPVATDELCFACFLKPVCYRRDAPGSEIASTSSPVV